MNPFDLQIQTTASDGKHTPSECVRMAKENGVHTIAITDHDTVTGIPEALAAGEELGVRVIPGIEISSQEHGIHLLGLGIDIRNGPLNAAMEKAAANRVTAARQMVKKFQAGGFAVEWEDVLGEAGGAVIGRPHIVSAIMKRPENAPKLGGVATKQDFFAKFFGRQSPYYVPASSLTAGEAIELVHGAGGVAVWSHPPLPDFVGNCPELEKFLKGLIPLGLDGLELFGPALTEGDFACLETVVGRYRLLATAGSDFHERSDLAGKPWPRSAATIGDYPTFGKLLDDILPRLDAAIAERKRAIAPGS